MMRGQETVAEVKSSAEPCQERKVQLTSDHNSLLVFCCLNVFLNLILTPLFLSYQTHLMTVIVAYGLTS